MLNINSAPLLVGVLNPTNFSDDLNYLINNPPNVIEYRADLTDYSDTSLQKNHIKIIREKTPFPILFTLRDKSEGGAFSDNNNLRIKIYSEVLCLVDAIDLEAALARENKEVITAAAEKDVTVILSYHNFEKTPAFSELEKIIDNCLESNANIAKVATMCNTESDALNLLKLSVEKKNVALVGMGKFGALTRVAAPALGSMLTYAFTDCGNELVANQITVDKLKVLWENVGIK